MKLERLRLRTTDRAVVRRPVALRHRAVRAIAADGQRTLDRGGEDHPATIGWESQVGTPETARRRRGEHDHGGRDARGEPRGEHAARAPDRRCARRRASQRRAKALEIGWERLCHFNSLWPLAREAVAALPG